MLLKLSSEKIKKFVKTVCGLIILPAILTLTIGISFVLAGGANTGDWLADTPNRDNLTVAARTTTTTGDYLNGDMADLKIWNRALSATEVTALYNSYSK